MCVQTLTGRLSPQVFSVLWVKETGCLYSLSSCGLSKWEVDENGETQVLSWSTSQIVTDSITDAIWVRNLKLDLLTCFYELQKIRSWHTTRADCLKDSVFSFNINNNNNNNTCFLSSESKYESDF